MVDLTLSFYDAKDNAIAVQREKAHAAAERVDAFEVLTETVYDDAALRQHQDAFAKLKTGDSGGLASLAALVGLRPEDSVATFRLKRLLNEWTGMRIEVR